MTDTLYDGDMVRTEHGKEGMIISAGYGTVGNPDKEAVPAYKVRFPSGEVGWYMGHELEKVS